MSRARACVARPGLFLEANQGLHDGSASAADRTLSIDAFTLKFAQPGLEQSFWQHYRPLLRRVDACSAWLLLVMALPGNVTMLASLLPISNIPRTEHLVACERVGHGLAVLTLLHLLVLHMYPALYIANRTKILLLLRGCVLKLAAFQGYGQCPAVSRWFTNKPESQFSAFAFRGGIVSLLWHSLGAPLPFSLHAPVQLLFLLTYMLQLAPAVCKHIGDVKGGAATVQQADAVMNWVRVELLGGARDSGSGSCSSSSTSSGSGVMEGLDAACGTSDAMYELCVNYQLALQVVIGFVLPCLLMYCCEVIARWNWSVHHRRQQQQQRLQQ